MNNNTTLWLTLISIAFFGVSIMGFANGYEMITNPEYGTSPLLIGAILYGILGLVVSIGIWKKRKWVIKAIIAFIITMLLFSLIFQITIAQLPWIKFLIHTTLTLLILGSLLKYVKKNI